MPVPPLRSLPHPPVCPVAASFALSPRSWSSLEEDRAPSPQICLLTVNKTLNPDLQWDVLSTDQLVGEEAAVGGRGGHLGHTGLPKPLWKVLLFVSFNRAGWLLLLNSSKSHCFAENVRLAVCSGGAPPPFLSLRPTPDRLELWVLGGVSAPRAPVPRVSTRWRAGSGEAAGPRPPDGVSAPGSHAQDGVGGTPPRPGTGASPASPDGPT